MPLVGLAVFLTVSLVLSPLAAGAQQTSKVWRIGFVAAETASTSGHFLEAFRFGMRDHGYVRLRSHGGGEAQGLIVFIDPLTVRHRGRIVELAAKVRLPAIYGFREFADTGGLMAYGSSVPALCRRAAMYIDKILKGAKPGDLPVEQATQFEFVINRKTAKTLGLTIPQTLLLQANEVIE
jgi:putative ABC transport system substrate-binding protein